VPLSVAMNVPMSEEMNVKYPQEIPLSLV
jgi:hypothetical protein